jgi:hypothetical protein
METALSHPPDTADPCVGSPTPDVNSLAASEAYANKNFGGAANAGISHSMDFLTYAYLQTGQDAKAKGILDKRGGIEKWVNHLLPGDMGYAAIPVRYALERNQWNDAAALTPVESQYPQAVAMGHFARALGAARSGHAEQSETCVDRCSSARIAL